MSPSSKRGPATLAKPRWAEELGKRRFVPYVQIRGLMGGVGEGLKERMRVEDCLWLTMEAFHRSKKDDFP